jgi:2'-5' RNA ligase
MRVFYALPVPPAACRRLGEAALSLKNAFRGLAVPREAGLHFTLFFFGEVDAAGAVRLGKILEEPSLVRPAIRARFAGIGTFPAEGNPRIIYAAVDEGGDEIAALERDLRRLLERARWPLEDERRPFHPHVTLGRNKAGRISRDELARIVLPAEIFFIDRCVLFQSILKPSGAEYLPLKERLLPK